MSSVQLDVHKTHLVDQQTANSGEPKDAVALVKSLIGSGVLQEKATRSVEYWQGNSMPDTGLAYNISGRATVIEAKVGESLAGFDDPIKGVFSTQICTDKSVIVKRKWVVGGKAVLTPERSAARSVSVQEDAVKVDLSRYGGDISMNTNLFLDGPLATEELDMKVDAQKRELERKLVELGYAELMSRALRLPTAFVRSTVRQGGMSAQAQQKMQERRAKSVYLKTCFGAFGKYEFPLTNLLAAAKTASAYTGSVGGSDVMIVPHGTPEMLKYTKQSSMEYKITGLKTTDRKPITMSIDNVFEDPATNVKIAIHRPLATYSNGSAFPQAGKNCLEETVTLWLHYPIPRSAAMMEVTDFMNGGVRVIGGFEKATDLSLQLTSKGSSFNQTLPFSSESHGDMVGQLDTLAGIESAKCFASVMRQLGLSDVNSDDYADFPGLCQTLAAKITAALSDEKGLSETVVDTGFMDNCRKLLGSDVNSSAFPALRVLELGFKNPSESYLARHALLIERLLPNGGFYSRFDRASTKIAYMKASKRLPAAALNLMMTPYADIKPEVLSTYGFSDFESFRKAFQARIVYCPSKCGDVCVASAFVQTVLKQKFVTSGDSSGRAALWERAFCVENSTDESTGRMFSAFTGSGFDAAASRKSLTTFSDLEATYNAVCCFLDDLLQNELSGIGSLKSVCPQPDVKGDIIFMSSMASQVPQGAQVGHFATASGGGATHLVRRVKFSMLNAVIAKAGDETGSLLVGYPMTSVSTNARTESMTVALRVYLGSILKRPENAMVLPHVAFGGVISDSELMTAKVVKRADDSQQPASTETFDPEKHKFVIDEQGSGSAVHAKMNAELADNKVGMSRGSYVLKNKNNGTLMGTRFVNDGALGHLDDPEYYEVFSGLQVYKPPPRRYSEA